MGVCEREDGSLMCVYCMYHTAPVVCDNGLVVKLTNTPCHSLC